MSQPDCPMDDQVEATQAKIAKWVDGIRTRRINATNVSYVLTSGLNQSTHSSKLSKTNLTSNG